MKHSYRPDIDGLRAVAVLSVLFYHLGFTSFSGGYLGVDVFFVISGFLITRILQEEMAAGQFSYANFYERRVRRILPSALATLGISILGAFLFFSPKDIIDFAHSMLATLGFVSNIYFWQHIGYFTADTNVKPLLHMWSLSVEEQFYVVWPLLLAFLLSKARSIILFATIGIISVLSLAAAVYYNSIDPNATFYLLPFRMFEFLIGSATVWLIVHPPKQRIVHEALTILGILLIALAVTATIPVTPFPSLYSLVPCIGTALVIYAGAHSQSRWLLANRAAVAIGLISYQLYLMHWPVYVYYQYRLLHTLTLTDKMIIILITALLAFAVYYVVDKPLRRVKDRKQLIRFGSGTLAAVLLLTATACSMSADKGWPWRLDEQAQTLTSDPIAYHHTQFGGINYMGHEPYTLGDSSVPPSFIFFGDSFAMQYASALDRLLKENHKSATALFHSICMVTPDAAPINRAPDDEKCNATYAKAQGLFTGNNLPVVIAQSWHTYKDIIADKSRNKMNFATEADYYQFIFGQIDKMHHAVGPQRKFVLIGVAPGMGDQQGIIRCFSMPTYLPNDCSANAALPLSSMTQGLQFDTMAASWAKQRANVTFINPRDVVCDDKTCWAFKGTELYYSDYIHFSNAGGWLVVNHFRDIFLGL